jgi:hypothetical protein
MVLGTMVACVVAAAGVFIQEHLDPSFRTPAEVSAELDVPLLAAVPQRYDGFQRTGTYGDGIGRGRDRDRELAHVAPMGPIDSSGG